jgi:hypothetical protein
MGPHLAIHCGGNDHRCSGGEAGGGYCVTGESTSHGAEPLCCRRCNEDRVGAIGGNDVTDATVWKKVEEVRVHRVAGQCAQGER